MSTPLSPRELKLVLDEREECAKVAADFASATEWIHSTTNYTAPMIAAAIRSRPQPSAPERICGNIPQLPPALGELIGRLDERGPVLDQPRGLSAAEAPVERRVTPESPERSG